MSKINDEQKKKEIINLLSECEEDLLNTNKISLGVGVNFNKAESLLKDLLMENKIEKLTTGYSDLWRLK